MTDDSYSTSTTLEAAARATVAATRRLVRSAFLVGLVTVLASAGVAYLGFSANRGALLAGMEPEQAAALTAELRANDLPWGIGIAVVVFGLVPFTFALLYRSYRVTQDAAFLALAAHRQSEDRYRDLYHKTPVMMHSIDDAGMLIGVNAYWLTTLGYRRSEVLGCQASEFLTPASREVSEQETIPRLLRKGSCQDVPLQVVTRDGHVLDVLMSASVERGKPGEVLRIRAMLIDVTRLKHAERERDLKIKELEEKNEELQRFTYTVSHDLKSPLVTVKGFLGFVEKDAAEGNLERLKDDIARINEAADRMKLLLDELLELSRIGRFVQPPEDVHLGELAAEVQEILAGGLAERGVDVRIASDMPTVHCDRNRLSQALQNLLENAVKYMGDQEKPRIEIGWYRSGDPLKGEDEETVFFVRDNGMGIEERYLKKIFGLFEKMSTASDGTGIGLALVRRIVEVHGGHIWATSDGPGTGMTFHFTLPGIAEPEATEDADA